MSTLGSDGSDGAVRFATLALFTNSAALTFAILMVLVALTH